MWAQGKQSYPLPPYQLTPNPLTFRLLRQGGLCDHLTHHPQLHPGSAPKPSHNGSVSYFWLQTRHSLSRNRTQNPPAYVTSNAPPQHLPVLIYNTDFNDVPKTEPQQAGFGLLA